MVKMGLKDAGWVGGWAGGDGGWRESGGGCWTGAARTGWHWCPTSSLDPRTSQPHPEPFGAAAAAAHPLPRRYEYLVIDDCWAEKQRPEDGLLVGKRATFPGGMKALGRYIHGKGLKYGIYSDAGTATCARYPGASAQGVGRAFAFHANTVWRDMFGNRCPACCLPQGRTSTRMWTR